MSCWYNDKPCALDHSATRYFGMVRSGDKAPTSGDQSDCCVNRRRSRVVSAGYYDLANFIGVPGEDLPERSAPSAPAHVESGTTQDPPARRGRRASQG